MPAKYSVHKYTQHSYGSRTEDRPSGTIISSGANDSVVEAINTRSAGSSIPGFKQKMRRLEPTTTGLDGQKTEFNVSGSFDLQLEYHGAVGSGLTVKETSSGIPTDAFPPPSYDPNVIPSVANEALTRFLGRVSDSDIAFSGLQFLAEIKDTVTMIKSPVKSLRNGFSDYLADLRKARHRKESDKLNILSDTWLEYQLGFQPLLSDAEAGAVALSRVLNNIRVHKIQASADGQELVSLDTPNTLLLLNDHCLFSFIRLIKDITYKESSVRYKGLVRVNAEGPEPAVGLSQTFGLTLSQFVPTLWEVVPWSFVIDYFVNIGDLIGAQFTSLAHLRWYNRSDHVSMRRTATYISDPKQAKLNLVTNGYPDPSKLNYFGSVTKEASSTSFSRRGGDSSSLGTPSLEFNIPSSSSKWLNMAALLSQMKKRPYL